MRHTDRSTDPVLGHFAIVPGVTTDRAGRTSPTLTAVAEQLRATARRWEVLEVAGHQDPRRRFERHLQKGDIVWIRWRPVRPRRGCHVVLKLKNREERISPSLLDAELHRHCGSPTRSVPNGDPAPLKGGHKSGRVGGDTPGGFGPPPRCARTPLLSAFSRTCCRADRARRSSSRPGVESRRSRASRAGSRACRHPAVAAQELVAHGQIRLQDRANLRRARGVE